MNQRYIDRFRSVFGTTAVTVVNKFLFTSDLYITDDACTEYASRMLWNNRFLYAKAKKDDPNVSPASHFSIVHPVTINLQRWTGAFHAPLLLQVFSVYFNIVNNGFLVEGLKYQLTGRQPRAALALAATAVRHSLLDDV